MVGGGGAGGGGGGKAAAAKSNNVVSSIPAGSRKMVQSLKEIVSCSEQEIYAILVECNMDPDEAVNRLLSLDAFHEVKSKREKKKENKDTTDSRQRGTNYSSNRGARVGTDRYAARGGAIQFISNEPGSMQGKPSNRRENGTRSYTGASSSAPGVIGCQPPSNSESMVTESKRSSAVLGDVISSSSQTSTGYQPAWLGVPGKMSMADIVKKGMPPMTHPPQDFLSSDNTALKTSEMKSQDMPVKDEWPSIEKPTATRTVFVLKATSESELYPDSSNLSSVRTDQHQISQLDEDHLTGNRPVESPGADQVRPSSVSSRNLQEDDSWGSSLYDDSMYKKNMDSYQTQRHPLEHNGAEDVTSTVAASLQQLRIENDDQAHEGTQSDEDKPGVIIPDHLQVHTSDCLHLSFGSFGTFVPKPLNDGFEDISEVADDSSFRHSDNRDAEFYGDEPLVSDPDGNIGHRIDASVGNYDSSSDSPTEALKQETPEAVQENQYRFSSSAPEPDYTFENNQQLNSAFGPQQTNPQIQNLDAFSNVMQAYTNSLPSALLPSNVQTVREPTDIQYSPFPVTQSLPTRYSSAAASLTDPNISMAEALRAANISPSQPSQQTDPDTSIAAAHALAQHLAMNPYSQPTLPLGHYANMIGYPFLPQSYAYMPSAFQQTFAGNSTYHQSLAAMLPQFKNNVSVGNLPPQSATVASGYGFGNSSSVPGGNLPLNPSAAAAGSTIGYDDVLSSQFKEPNHLASLQQNENTAAWLQGPGSRTIPGSTYYSFPGQNQQPPGFRQGQHYGAHGYPNIYHSQTGMPLDNHQLQNPRDGSLGGPQGQAAKQTQHIWQNNY